MDDTAHPNVDRAGVIDQTFHLDDELADGASETFIFNYLYATISAGASLIALSGLVNNARDA